MTGTLTRIGAVVRKEFIHVGRDKRLLAVVLVMPIMQLLLFAYAISFDVRNLPTLVVDLDHTPDSTAYVRAYEASGLFDVTGHGEALADVDRAFDRNEARVAVVVPAGFARALARGEVAQVGIYVDGSEPNSARVAETYAAALNQRYGLAAAAFVGSLTASMTITHGQFDLLKLMTGRPTEPSSASRASRTAASSSTT